MGRLKMLLRVVLVMLGTVCTVGANPAEAKSVYAITEHYVSTFKAYKIQGDQLSYQTTAQNLPYRDNGPVDVTCSTDPAFLFITYEDSDLIELVNAKSMVPEGEPVKVPGATDLAAIIYDAAKQRVYTVVRRKNFDFIGFFLQS